MLSAEDWFNESENFKAISNHEEAIKCYNQALALKPDYLEALYEKGMALMRQKKHFAALNCLEGVLKLDANYARAYSGVGMVFNSQGDYELALEWVEKAITIDANNEHIYTNKAIVLDGLERPLEAIAAYQQALRINPKNTMALWGLGCTLEREERYQEALNSYDSAVELEPCAMFQILRGRVLKVINREREALEAFTEAYDLYEMGKLGNCLSAGNFNFLKDEIKAVRGLQRVAADTEARLNELQARTEESDVDNSVVVEEFRDKIGALQADKDKLSQIIISSFDNGKVSKGDKEKLDRLKEEFAKQLAEIEAAMK